MISFPCPHCAKVLKVKDLAAGKHGNCPHCGKPIEVPRASAVSLADADSPTLPPKVEGDKEKPQSPSGTAHVSTVSSGDGNTLGEPEAARPELTSFLASPQQADELGRLGPYRVLKVLGAGGMGVVFKAEDSQLKRQVALKVMLPTLGASDSARKRFLREAQSAAALDHDHIVHIYQVGEDRGVPFMAMQFLRGQPLDERLKTEPKLPIAEAIRIGRETAKGLAAAHELGLIHRDIKPANLWLEADGRVKILDFGLARAVGDETHLTQDGAIIGTPAYMAPEQASNKAVDHRSDLFSLGCVLDRLCTGEMPFKGSDTISILSALALEEPVDPVECNLAVPRALSDLIMEMLAKKPAGRPASAQVVVARLEEIASDQTAVLPSGIKARSTKVRVDGQASAVPRRPPASTRPTLFWAAVAGVVLAVGLGGFFLLRELNSNRGGGGPGEPPGP